MKTFLIIIVTAVITWFAFSAIQGLRTATEHVWMISAIKAPGRMALEEIQKDMNAGRYGLAKAKLQAFTDIWQRFERGPDSCSGRGIGDVMVAFSTIDTNRASNPGAGEPTNGRPLLRSETNRTSPATGSGR